MVVITLSQSKNQMKLHSLRISNFQSFGESPVELSFEDLTFLIGPNGSGKTAAMQALCRLFSIDPSLRRIQRTDFHIPLNETGQVNERELWIEVDFHFPELVSEDDSYAVPPHFSHMRLDESDGTPRVRYRLTANMGIDGDIEESFDYVLDADEKGVPLSKSRVSRIDRGLIQVHYLPARRDPSDHIAYGANALLGKMLRSVNWGRQREDIKTLVDGINRSLNSNDAIDALGRGISQVWGILHKGQFFTDPSVTFEGAEIESFLRHMSVSFSPSHEGGHINFSRLSDGQQSMLYLSLVLSSQAMGRIALAGGDEIFDVNKLRPPVFTIVAIEEPENSLSPCYLGRIIDALNVMVGNHDSQAIIATHAPSMLRRINPECIRYFRLSDVRESQIKLIDLPEASDAAFKFVREAIQAFPEIYFSRLVVLGEGDSEEIVLPRLLLAKGISVDGSGVTIAPLGGRHVNHFWRLLSALKIPYMTLLDLDVGRHQGGWGRIKYVNDQLIKYEPDRKLPEDYPIPPWNSPDHKVRTFENYLEALEERGVYFSNPLDLDFAMMSAYPKAYDVEEVAADQAVIKAVLGKGHYDLLQYANGELELFESYHQLFHLGSKPVAHIGALMELDNLELAKSMPPSLDRLTNAIIDKLSRLPE